MFLLTETTSCVSFPRSYPSCFTASTGRSGTM